MQKEIKVEDYIRNMTQAITKYFHDDEEQTFLLNVIYVQALLFIKTFGLGISRNMIKAFEEVDCEYSEEYYKAVFILYKNMRNESATAFIGHLKGLVVSEERKEEVS